MDPVETIDVVLVDDHAIVRGGLRMLLENHSDIKVVGEAGTLAEAREVLERVQPDVVIIDVQLAHHETGLDLIPYIHSRHPAPAVLVLSAFLNPVILQRCADEGVSGYLLKDTRDFDLPSAVRITAHGGRVFDANVYSLERQIGPAGFEGLTPRETQVLGLVCKGSSNRDIANELGVSENAVKGCVSSIMRHFGCRNRVQVVLKAKELNLF